MKQEWIKYRVRDTDATKCQDCGRYLDPDLDVTYGAGTTQGSQQLETGYYICWQCYRDYRNG